MKDARIDCDLHKLLKSYVYDHALVSTFTFSPRFFEEYMLERFKALQGKGGITVFLDRGQYEEVIECTAQDKDWVPKLANRRYLLQPVSVPGVFHPKVFLFTSEKRGLLIIGSANFTQDGLGGNAELVSVFEFEVGKKEEALALFQSAFQFFESLIQQWPSKDGSSNVDEVRRDTPWLTSPLDKSAPETIPSLLHNLDEALWPQIVKGLGSVDELSLVSRFFDKKPQILDSVCKNLGQPKVNVYTEPKRGGLSPDWLKYPYAHNKSLSIYHCKYGDAEHRQPLHAKGYALSADGQTTLAIGSANFSTAALLRRANAGNVEVMLLYPPQPTHILNPMGILDPLSNGKEVTHPDQLVAQSGVEGEPVNSSRKYEVVLMEVRLEGDILRLSTEEKVMSLSCRLSQANVAPRDFSIEESHSGELQVKLPSNWVKRMVGASTVAQLVATRDASVKVSNPVLVAAIFDPRTGQGARQSRRLREATESPQRFMGVLHELYEWDDELSLKNFLNNCNIPINLTHRSLSAARRDSSYDGPPAGFGDLGERGLIQFTCFHEAVVTFVRRHRSRLSQHVENGKLLSVSNYLQVMETLILLLVDQIERAKGGLAKEGLTVLSVDEWKSIRTQLAEYYQEIEKLLSLTVCEYLPSLHEKETSRTVHEMFEDAPDRVLGLCTKAVAARVEIAKSLDANVVIQIKAYQRKKACFFHSLLSDEKWRDYCKKLKTHADQWRKAVSV
ncbi:hypothetical protein ACFPK9_10695 [Rubritalea spongiae]|uniref:PLD phosphodiesterase domain-containing protein n=1 Tax=Rubritalea spongiae TaxID=430797 RepID=A0ABW5E2Q4_9BACT